MKSIHLLLIFAILALLMVPITVYLTWMHFVPAESHFCDLGEQFRCSDVAKTPYAMFLGVPNAVWGFFTYSFMFVISLGLALGWNFKRINKNLGRPNMYYLLLFVSGFGLVFSLYLTYIEFFVIHMFCILCLIQQGTILALFLLALVLALFYQNEIRI